MLYFDVGLNLNEYFKLVLVPYCPFFEHLESYTSHQQQDRSSVLVITYEELSTDVEEVIRVSNHKPVAIFNLIPRIFNFPWILLPCRKSPHFWAKH